jgi:methylphosphotriester-DNA--protein-cysteine methyltransferase
MSLHDPLPEGILLYGVATTGIYCRPECPSPPPLPSNLRFFASPAAAAAAGFRPCKRCRPAMAAAP